MAKHRAPRYVRTKQALATGGVAAGATAVGLGVLSSPAQAATTHDWSGVAQCESGGNWSINTGNGFYGGLQFSQSTWAAFGGTAFAPRADLASPAQQVQIAEKVLAGQGVGAWPNCGKHLKDGATSVAARTPAPAPAPAPAPEPAPQPAPAVEPTTPPPAATQSSAAAAGGSAAPAGTYTVRTGDTVAEIAAAHGQTWRALYQRNVGVIGNNPDLIFPGQRLATSEAGQAAPAAQAPAAQAPAAAPAAVAAPAPATTVASITNSAGR